MSSYYRMNVQKAKEEIKKNTSYEDKICKSFCHLSCVSEIQDVPDEKKNDFRLLKSEINKYMINGKIEYIPSEKAELIIKLIDSI